jgi:hypothetical protein
MIARRSSVVLLTLAALAGCACGRRAAAAVASLTMRCTPIADGVSCRVMALSRDVGQAAREVTREASWQISDSGIGYLSSPGVVRAMRDGNVDLNAEYASASAHAAVQLAAGRPGRVLGALHGIVFAVESMQLRPVPVSDVRVEVVAENMVGARAVTQADGSYELRWLVPGRAVLHATKAGYAPAAETIAILPGENVTNTVLRAVHSDDSRPPAAPPPGARGTQGTVAP